MANSFTTVGQIEQVNGENSTTWGDFTDTNWDINNLLIAGLSSQAITVADVTPADVNGVADAGKNCMFKTTGILTGNRSLIVPTKPRKYIVWNTCSGAYTMTVKTVAGTGIVVPQNSVAILECDGTNIIDVNTPVESISVAISDETTALTTGLAKITFRMPYGFVLTDVRASLTTASSSGIPTFNIKESGTTIFSTKLTVDANELTSTTAAVPYVFSDYFLASDAQMTIDIDIAGTNATGAKIYFIGRRTI